MAEDKRKDMEDKKRRKYMRSKDPFNSDEEPIFLVKNALGMYMSVPASMAETFRKNQEDPEYIRRCAESTKEAYETHLRCMEEEKKKKAEQEKQRQRRKPDKADKS